MATIRKPFIGFWAALLAAALSFGLTNSGKAADKGSLTSLACASAPDLVLTNGKILTVDENDSIASTVRIRGDRIITVGEEVGPIDACTEIIDLGGSTVIPGFIDAHVHYLRSFVRIGHTLPGIRTLRSISDLQDAIERFAATIPVAEGPTISDDFIVALRGWRPSGFAENRLPTLDELDQAAPNHPVVMMQFGGPGVTNSMGKVYLEENGVSVADDGLIARGPGPAFLGRQPAYDALAKNSDARPQEAIFARAYGTFHQHRIADDCRWWGN